MAARETADTLDQLTPSLAGRSVPEIAAVLREWKRIEVWGVFALDWPHCMTLLRLVPVVLGAAVLAGNLFAQRPEILIADFEGTNYGEWKATGEAFGPGPAQMMFFPCELTLRTTPAGPRLAWQPVKEIERLRTKTHQVNLLSRKPGEDPLANLNGELFDLRAEFEVGTAAEAGLRIRGTAILYDVRKHELVCRDRRVPFRPVDGTVRLRVLVDRTSLEIFADGGLIYMPMPFRPDPAAKPVAVIAPGGEAEKCFLEVSELKSIWPG